MQKLDDERPLGVRHAHDWLPVTALPRLQAAHDVMRWDVSKSRILSVSACAVCGELDRDSVTECTGPTACADHPICKRPYR